MKEPALHNEYHNCINWWIVESGPSLFSRLPWRGLVLSPSFHKRGLVSYPGFYKRGLVCLQASPREQVDAAGSRSSILKIGKYLSQCRRPHHFINNKKNKCYSAWTAPAQDQCQQRAGHKLRQYFLYNFQVNKASNCILH